MRKQVLIILIFILCINIVCASNFKDSVEINNQKIILEKNNYAIGITPPNKITSESSDILIYSNKELQVSNNDYFISGLFVDEKNISIIDVIYNLSNAELKEYLVFKKKIPEFTNTDLDIEFNVSFTFDEKIQVVVNNKIITSCKDIFYPGAIHIRKNGLDLFTIPELIYFDSDKQQGILEKKVCIIGDNIYITPKITKSILETSTYPLYIDPSVVVGCDDNPSNVTCAHGSFSGNTIDTTKDIYILNATINGYGSGGNPGGEGLIRFNTSGLVYVESSILNSYGGAGTVGGNGAVGCVAGRNGAHGSYGGNASFIINANLINITNSTINNQGGAGGNGGTGGPGYCGEASGSLCGCPGGVGGNGGVTNISLESSKIYLDNTSIIHSMSGKGGAGGNGGGYNACGSAITWQGSAGGSGGTSGISYLNFNATNNYLFSYFNNSASDGGTGGTSNLCCSGVGGCLNEVGAGTTRTINTTYANFNIGDSLEFYNGFSSLLTQGDVNTFNIFNFTNSNIGRFRLTNLTLPFFYNVYFYGTVLRVADYNPDMQNLTWKTEYVNVSVNQLYNDQPLVSYYNITPYQVTFGENVSILINVTDGDNISYVNFTLTSPTGYTPFNNLYGVNLTNGFWNSSSFIINESGTWNYYINYSDGIYIESISNSFEVPDTKTITPNSIVQSKQPSQDFNFTITFNSDSNASVDWNISYDESLGANFTLSGVNEIISFVGDYNHTIKINISENCTDSDFYGFVNVTRVIDNYVKNISINISVLLSDFGEIVLMNDSNYGQTINSADTLIKQFLLNNTGTYNLSDVSCELEGDYIGKSFWSFNIISTIEPNMSEIINMTITGAPASSYSGKMKCYGINSVRGTTDYTESGNQPIISITVTSASTPPGGGGSSSTIIQNLLPNGSVSGFCNYNGICEPELGEDFLNCGDVLDSISGKVLKEGDCQPPRLAELAQNWIIYVLIFIAVLGFALTKTPKKITPKFIRVRRRR